MFKYVLLILLFVTINVQAHHHTLTAANIAITEKISPLLNTGCTITDRLNKTNDEDDIVTVVTVSCNKSNSFIQYLVNVYDAANGDILVTPPIIVGADFDFKVDLIIIDGEIVTLKGKQWVESDKPCDPSLTSIRTYVLHNHLLTIEAKND